MGTREQVLAWWNTPEAERQPPTRKELASSLDVSKERVSQIIRGLKPKEKIDNGDFDLKTYLRGNLPQIAAKLVDVITTSTNAKAIELALKALGELVEKREDTLKVEYSSGEIARDAGEIIGYLQQRLEEAGTCPVCGKPSILLAEVCDNQES